MKIPRLYPISSGRDMIRTFAGYDRRAVISDGASSSGRSGTLRFRDTEGVVSDDYPTVRTRKTRGRVVVNGDVNTRVADIIDIDGKLAYIRAGQTNYPLVYDGVAYDLSLGSGNGLRLMKMGAYIIVTQDRTATDGGVYLLRYLNTADPTDRGSVPGSEIYKVGQTAADTVNDRIFVVPCDKDGLAYKAPITDTAPTGPVQGDWWVDTSGTADVLKRYTGASWEEYETEYLMLKIYVTDSSHAASGRKRFNYIKAGMRCSVTVTPSSGASQGLEVIAGDHIVTADGSDNGSPYIVFPGTIDKHIRAETETPETTVRVEGVLPVLDYVFECNNRLWGCRYGDDGTGNKVNEIYASALGDFRVWSQEENISTDGWVASCGTDGPWTGACAFQGYPTFFKENVMYRVYGSYPAQYQYQQTPCDGVMKGSSASLAVVNNVLYYKSRAGICAFSGSLPVEIGAIFGGERYENAVGGAYRDRYFVSMRDDAGAYHLFCHDTGSGIWYREDGLRCFRFAACTDDLFATTASVGDPSVYKLITLRGDGASLVSSVENPITWSAETGPVGWYLETGDMGLASPDHKYVSRITLRMKLAVGAHFDLYISYDDGEWEHTVALDGFRMESFPVPVAIRRCDHFRLKMTGEGFCQIYSITKTTQGGSEI